MIAQSVEHWAMGWMIGVLGFDSRRGLGIFIFTIMSRMALGPTQPPIQWVPGALSLGVKRPGREAIPPLPQYVFMAWCLVKHRDKAVKTEYVVFWIVVPCSVVVGSMPMFSEDGGSMSSEIMLSSYCPTRCNHPQIT
jgi:hypothetical protein